MMDITGANVLELAFNALNRQAVVYYKFLSRAVNEIGQDVSTYDAPVTKKGSVQAIPKSLYQQYGLDLAKTYVNFYVSNDSITVDRDVAGDQFVFAGNTYNCESATAWFSMDGWTAIRAVRVNAG